MSDQSTKFRWFFIAAVLAVASEAVLWMMCNRYGKMIDNDEWNTLGTVTFIFHIPGQMMRELLCPSYPASDRIGIPIIVTTGGIQFLLVYWCLLRAGICIWRATTPNKRGAGNGGIGLLFQVGRPRPAVPDRKRSAVP